ncbi:MAG: hypothetical protein GY884_27255 [Proteobacteria bacterium]|nr:hypothetical protein [Pseudomonadota bacterium]
MLLPLVPLVGLILAGPLVEPVFMGFLESGRMGQGVAGLGLRLGLLACGAMSLATYTALVRGPERAVLDPHPADAGALLRYLVIRTGWERLGWIVAAAALVLPVLRVDPLAWALTVWVAAMGWLIGLCGGFPVHLGSVWAAESPALAGVMNLLRGNNPRLQAALIYGPGVAFGLGAVGVWTAATGAELVLSGQAIGWAWLAAPLGVALVTWLPGPGLARAYHFRTTLLLAEIDAAYAGQEDPAESLRVYLDWTVRFAPAPLRLELLNELRHGWRGLRSWITGAWGLGGLSALSGWSVAPEALPRTLLIGGAAVVFTGVVAIRLEMTDPLWLDHALPRRLGRKLGGRLLAVFLWLQGAVIPGVLALGIRQGAVAAGVLGWLELLALVIAATATGASRLRGRGLPPYLLTGLLLWAGLATVFVKEVT